MISNKINSFDKFIKVLTNNDRNVPRWLSQHIYVKLFSSIDDIKIGDLYSFNGKATIIAKR